jgi:hypothetical protein
VQGLSIILAAAHLAGRNAQGERDRGWDEHFIAVGKHEEQVGAK